MTIRRFLSLACAVALAIALQAAAAAAAPTAVDVRVEGKTSTIFFGPVTTDAKVVNPPTGGAHLCDGTNFGANPVPGPTPTTALDDASIKGGFTWDADWFGPGFPDYAVNRVGSEPSTSSEFWGVFVNGVDPGVGGCQKLLKAGDEVLWTFDAFNKPGGALRLSVPAAIQTGQAAVTTVTNVATGAPVAGATVGSATTGADGTAALTFDEPGVYVLRADRPDAIRSREARVCVDPPLVEACTSTDRTAPSIENSTPAISSSTTRSEQIRVSWLGDDGSAGSGVRRYRVEQRRIDLPGKAWRPLVTDRDLTEKRTRGRAGAAYEFRVQAIDRAGNASPWAAQTTVVPLDNLSARLRLSRRGWQTLKRHGAFESSVSRANRARASATLRFTGTRATLVTRLLPKGGRLRVTVDGDAKVVSLKGKTRFRRKLVATGSLEPGTHTLRVTSLGRAPVEIDAIAIRP
jgi:hypothetical protein